MGAEVNQKIKVGIVAGGPSSEHEISCISANGVLGAIDRNRFEPILIGITKSGKWVLPPDGYKLGLSENRLPIIDEGLPETSIDKLKLELKIDLLFPVLHGPYGEDGIFQGECERAGVKYVGSGVKASANGMDKTLAKRIFQAHGLEVSPGMDIQKEDWESAQAELLTQAAEFGFPLFVKPARSGSSRGTSKVKKLEDLKAAINFAFTFDTTAMIEVAIVGREIECAVLQTSGSLSASPVGEVKILGKHEFYDFDAKYLDGSTEFLIPAELPSEISEAIRATAVKAFSALECRGLARVDFFYTGEKIIINEINTMPGFTATSVFPKLWAAGGIAYTELITKLIADAN